MVVEERAPTSRPSPDQTTNLFFALRPAADEAQRIVELREELVRKGVAWGRGTSPERLHLTLLGLSRGRGRLPRTILDAISRSVSAVRFPQFEVMLDELMCFRVSTKPSPIVAAGEKLADVAALRLAVRDALRVKGFQVSAGDSYKPHVTLLWGSSTFEKLAIRPVCWTAREIVLVESWVGATRHVRLGAWPLGSPPQRI